MAKHSHVVSTPENIAHPPQTYVRGHGGTKLARRGKEQENAGEVCNSETCKSYADGIKANLAKNYTQIDPCTDFSAYACDGWTDTHNWRPDQTCEPDRSRL